MDPLYFKALATLETADGQKTIKGPKGEDSNNLYNIKDFSGKGFRALDKAEGSNDAYRVYGSRDEATSDLIGLLSRKYPKALEATNREQFAMALKAGGYASDPQYVEKFVSVYDRLAGEGDMPGAALPRPVAAPAAEPQGRALADLYAAAKGPRPPPSAKMTQTANAVWALTKMTTLPAAKADTAAAWYTRAADATVAEEQKVREADAQSVLDIARASFMSTFAGDALKRLSRPEFKPDGFVATEKDLVGFSVEEQDAMRQATSQPEFERIKFDIQDHKDRMLEAGKSGLGWALAGGLIAGAPEGYAVGAFASIAMARSAYGSIRLTQQGRKAAAMGALAAENVGAELALIAGQDYLSPFVGLQDYILAGAGGGLGMALHSPRVLRGTRDVDSKALDKILTEATESRAADLAAARKTLGPDADPKDIAQAAGQIQATRVRGELDKHTVDLDVDRKLIPDAVNDELFGDAPTPIKASAHEGMPDTSGISPSAQAGVPDTWVNQPFAGKGVLSAGVLRQNSLSDVGGASTSNLKAWWRRDNAEAAKSMDEFTNGWGVRYETLVATAPDRAVSFHLADKMTPDQRKLAQWLHKTFLPDLRVAVLDMDASPNASGTHSRGQAWDIGADISAIRFRTSEPHWQHTMIHEFGHIVFNRKVHTLAKSTSEGFKAVYDAWLKRYSGETMERPAQGLSNATDTAVRRGPSVSDPVKMSLGVQGPEGFIPTLMDVMAQVVNKIGGVNKIGPKQLDHGTAYIPNIREFSAEQFTKYIEAAVADVLDWKPASIPKTVIDFFKGLWDEYATLFNRVKQAGLIAPEQGVVDFFEAARKSAKANVTKHERELFGAPAHASSFEPSAMAAAPVNRTDAEIAHDYGIDTTLSDTPAQRAEQKAMIALYRKAEAYPMPDESRISTLLSSKPMQWAAPTALKLLTSKNPVARMVAAELLESGSGAGGRQTTAAISKWIHERKFMGNAINDFQRHYTDWRNANGGGLREDFFGGAKWDEFNRHVASELEARRAGNSIESAPAIRDAADVLTAAYDRMRMTQQRVKTPGWAALPESSHGYMPHRMSAGKVRAMTPDQARVVHSVLMEQFEALEGFDINFSNTLASKYLDIMRKRGTAGYSAPVGIHNAEAADIVQQSAAAMGMTRDEANALAKRVLRAAPSHTKHRLQLDLTRTYDADGQPFQLLDLFETDQLGLLRSQASRVSGEAALVRHGIMGSSGLNLLRRAMDFGTAEGKADNAALEAFDQVAAEFLGTPFGTQHKWLDRAVQFNSLASLGGMGFNQLAETLNGAITLGVRHALASVGSFARLRAEIIALSKGQQVNNPIIGSLETYGAEFGTDSYKLVFPFDMPDKLTQTYGVETVTAADRLLRSGAHLQGKLSLWRAITAAQQRGMAEQIVHKSLRYIRDGKADVALADMGIDKQLIDSIRAELPTAAKFDANGRLTHFDITKLENRAAADAFVQAVHRGTHQIIQGTFIGETGKWAHSSVLKLLTQFRTFSLVAIDKQWNRQVGNHGTAKALGMLLGTMSFAAPIFMIRAGIQSIGREDQDEYLDKQLHPANIAKQTLNYVALSGLSGDMIDALSAVAGYQPSGGRSGHNKSFVGNVIAPAAGKADDIWRAIQNSKEGTDVHDLAKQLPFAKLPWLYPAMNSLKPE